MDTVADEHVAGGADEEVLRVASAAGRFVVSLHPPADKAPEFPTEREGPGERGLFLS